MISSIVKGLCDGVVARAEFAFVFGRWLRHRIHTLNVVSRWFMVVSRWFMVVRGRVAVVCGSSRWRRGGCPMCLVVPLTGSARSQVALEHLS